MLPIRLCVYLPTTVSHRFHASIQDIERLGGGDRGVVPTLVAYTYFILSVVSLAFLLVCMYIFCSFRSRNLLRGVDIDAKMKRS